MKKNLISAVAAGLALALAITSFGCESGNDNPVHYAYTRARYGYEDAAAEEAGDVFTYVAKPNSYEAVQSNATMPATYYTTDHRVYGTTVGHYEWLSVIEGKNAYNVITSDDEKGDADGTTIGDRVSTVELQISLNAADKTYVVNTVGTQVAVNKLVDANYDAGAHEDETYASTYHMGWYVDGDETTDCVLDFISRYDPYDHRYTSSTYITPGVVPAALPAVYVEASTALIPVFKTNKEAEQLFHEAIVDQLEVIEKIKNDPEAREIDIAAAMLDLSNLQANMAFASGAEAWIRQETNLSGVRTVQDTFLTAEDGDIISNYITVLGEYEPITGTYKVASGNYKDGTILITSIEKDGVEIVFDDAEDKYYLDGMGPYKLSDNFYEADTARTFGGGQGKDPTYTKAGRTLTIAGGVLTSDPVFASYTSPSTYTVKTNDFLLGDSYDTYEAAYDDTKAVTASYTKRNTSYKFVLDDN